MAYIETLNSFNIAPKDAVRAFATVADMQAATDLDAGVTCHTNGFHEEGDGGAAFYIVSTEGTVNGMDVLACNDGLKATLVVQNSRVDLRQLGCAGNGTTDESSLMLYALSNYKYIDVYATLGISHVDITGLSGKTIDGHGVGGFVSTDREQTIISTDITNTSSSADNMTFAGLSFLGSGYYDGLTSSRQNSDSGLRIYNGGDSNTVSNCTFKDFGCVAVSISGDNATISNNVITCSIAFSGSYSPLNYNFGISVDGDNATVRGNLVSGCIQCIVTGDNFTNSRIVENNLTGKIQHCVYVEGGTGNVISGNAIDASDGICGIKIQNAASKYQTPIKNVTVSNNVINGAGEQGIYIVQLGTNGYCSNVVVSNNVFVATSRSVMFERCENCVASDNDCAVITDRYGIYLQNSKHVLVSGNSIHGARSGYGIYIATSDYLDIIDNAFHALMFGIYTGVAPHLNIVSNSFKEFSTGVHVPTPAASCNIRISANTFVMDSDIMGAIDGTHNYCILLQAGASISIIGNSLEKVGSANGDGIYAYGITTALNVVANVTEGFRYGFRRNAASDALTHAEANILNSQLVG